MTIFRLIKFIIVLVSLGYFQMESNSTLLMTAEEKLNMTRSQQSVEEEEKISIFSKSSGHGEHMDITDAK